jgi:ribosomal protein RSM22 (predicted rRNA methylase)
MEPLVAAIDAVTSRISTRELERAAAALSARYRSADKGRLKAAPTYISSSADRPLTDAERAAYLVVRAPATFAAVSAVLRELRARSPHLHVRNVLDLGAGPGVGAWAAISEFPAIDGITLVERDPGFVALGREIFETSGLATSRHVEVEPVDLRNRPTLPAHDLVLMSYALGELPGNARARALDAAWHATTGALVLVEPGTPQHFAAVLDARAQLVRSGASIAAPCPREDTCPMAGTVDWCHFAARLPRTSLHRRLKAGTLSYEDEKFSYVAAVRAGSRPAGSRVIRHPIFEKGRVTLMRCTPAGLVTEVITRRSRDVYRHARKAHWGDAWPPAEDEDSRLPGFEDSRVADREEL